MEAVEFTATGATHFLNTPLKDLNFKPGLLVAAIVHGGKLLIPRRPLHHLGGRPRDRGGKISVPQGPQRHSGPLSRCTEEGAT